MSGGSKSSSLNVLLGVTGSVAAIKTCETVKLIQAIPNYNHVNIKVIITEKSQHFVDIKSLTTELKIDVFDDSMEWKWEKRGDPVLHIDLTKWADVFVIAPLDCLTLSKIVHGHCDNLLSCVALAWPLKEKPLMVCPSMNPKMWEHPATKDNLAKIQAFGVQVRGPIAKKVMCGDFGMGAMEEPRAIADQLAGILQQKSRDHVIPTAIFGLGILLTILGITMPRYIRF